MFPAASSDMTSSSASGCALPRYSRGLYEPYDSVTSLYTEYSETTANHNLPGIDENCFEIINLSSPRSRIPTPRKSFAQPKKTTDAFGTRVLSTLSDNVGSLSRRSTLRPRTNSLATGPTAMPGRKSITNLLFAATSSSNRGPHDELMEEEDSEYIMDYKPSLTAGIEWKVSFGQSRRSSLAPDQLSRRPSVQVEPRERILSVPFEPVARRTSAQDHPVRRSSVAPDFVGRKLSLQVDAPPRRGSAQLSSLKSWFGAKQEPVPAPTIDNDVLLNINVIAELFPNGSIDPTAPASFNDLLQNAENLIRNLQAGYKVKAEALRAARAERETQAEETEEALTRARHLKIQLDDMAIKAAEQDRAMQALADELAAEKQSREEELQQKEAEAGDDDATPRRPTYSLSDRTTSDSGFESDVDSIMSGHETPVSPRAFSPRKVVARTKSDERWPVAWTQSALPVRSGIAGRNKGMTSAGDVSSRNRAGERVGAWSVVSSLRQENQVLKERIEDMDTQIEECLEFVNAHL